MLVSGIDVAIFAAISLLSAALALVATSRLNHVFVARQDAARARRPTYVDVARRYEFRDGYLISDVAGHDAFLSPDTDRAAAFDALTRALARLQPDLPDRLHRLGRGGEAFLVVGQMGPDPLCVSGRVEGDRLVVSVSPADRTNGRDTVESMALDTLVAEARDMRRVTDAAPAALWREDRQGQVIWANAAYLELAEQMSGGHLRWPLNRVFETGEDTPLDHGDTRRYRLDLPANAADPDPQTRWFELSCVQHSGAGTLMAAQPIDALVQTEDTLRQFVQTLSQTFAQLPVGLAVFDRARHLVMFNPALLGLAQVPTEVLSQRPSFEAFLDALREAQRIPEPRDYPSWRAEVSRLEAGAADGTYQEIWTLPNGDSLRVIGRPHADGGLAFIFEDISKEITLTRQFRGEMSLYQAVLDSAAEARFLFDRAGRLVFANAAARDLLPGDTPVAGIAEALGPLRALGVTKSDAKALEAFVLHRSGHLCDAQVPRALPLDHGELRVEALPNGAAQIVIADSTPDADTPPPRAKAPALSGALHDVPQAEFAEAAPGAS